MALLVATSSQALGGKPGLGDGSGLGLLEASEGARCWMA